MFKELQARHDQMSRGGGGQGMMTAQQLGGHCPSPTMSNMSGGQLVNVFGKYVEQHQ